MLFVVILPLLVLLFGVRLLVVLLFRRCICKLNFFRPRLISLLLKSLLPLERYLIFGLVNFALLWLLHSLLRLLNLINLTVRLRLNYFPLMLLLKRHFFVVLLLSIIVIILWPAVVCLLLVVGSFSIVVVIRVVIIVLLVLLLGVEVLWLRDSPLVLWLMTTATRLLVLRLLILLWLSLASASLLVISTTVARPLWSLFNTVICVCVVLLIWLVLLVDFLLDWLNRCGSFDHIFLLIH